MTKEEIYEHLAKVYLGKKKKKNQEQNLFVKVLLFANIALAVAIAAVAISKWDFTLVRRVRNKKTALSLALDNYPLRLRYNFAEHKPQKQNFSMYLPNIDVRSFDSLTFSIRGFSGQMPRMVKIALENQKKEHTELYFDRITPQWQRIIVPLANFKGISDWSQMTKVSFIFEAWNLDAPEGKVLIDDIAFLSTLRGR